MANKQYKGEAIKTLTPIADAQAAHKFKLGLFITGIIGIVVALMDLILIALQVANDNGDPALLQGIASGITSASVVFVVVLLIDIIFTANLNKYINDKQWLILFIPCFVLMITFSVPQIMTLVSLLISVKLPDFAQQFWFANYVNIAVCCIFIVAETIRMIKHKNDIDLKAEMKRALR